MVFAVVVWTDREKVMVVCVIMLVTSFAGRKSFLLAFTSWIRALTS